MSARYTPTNPLLLCQQSNFIERAQRANLSVPVVDGTFCSVLCVVHILLSLYRLRDWGPPKCWQPLAVAQSAPPVIHHCLRPLVLGVAGWAQGNSSRAMLPPACHNAAFTTITVAWPTALRKQRWGWKLLVTLQRV